MNRNTEAHFSKLPNVKIQRSLFDRSTQNKLSLPIGKLIPIFADEYLPGDTFTLDTSIVIRATNPFIKPIMDNLYADIYYFSVPNRLVWQHWKEFMGENTSGPWVQTTEYTIPQVEANSNGWTLGTIADYFGIPTGIPNLKISALWFRAYCLIWNEYFRDENLMNFTNVPLTDATTAGSNGSTLETDPVKGGKPLPVCKFHDYFTSALPSPQKGNPVTVSIAGNIPVFGNDYSLPLTTRTASGDANTALINLALDSYTDSTTGYTQYQLGSSTLMGIGTSGWTGIPLATNANLDETQQIGDNQYGPTIGLAKKEQLTTAAASGLYADGTQAIGITINQLREAFALQRLLEKDARGGTRYIELIKAHFNVNSPDARLQRPEYLGGKRIPINIDQVVQTSSNTSSSPQANVAAYSLTTDKSNSFTKSFTEHGMIIGLMCIRYEHTYQQGLNRMFSRKRRYDYYWPALANLGEQPIYSKEIKATGVEATDNIVFGFQERWAEYRYKPSQVCGQMRSGVINSLAMYHFADSYIMAPSLGQSWIQEDPANVSRTLSITTNYDPFIADIYFSYRCARPMPTYSVPGLIDHF